MKSDELHVTLSLVLSSFKKKPIDIETHLTVKSRTQVK